MASEELSALRDEISELDSKLLNIIAQRQQCTAKVADVKVKQQLSVRDKNREEQLLLRLIKQGQQAGLDANFITKLFQVIIEDSVLQQQSMLHELANPSESSAPKRVAFLGTKGSYSYLATQKYFARRSGEITEVPCKAFSEIIEKVESEQADFAVLPIENTTSGSINEVYDQLQHTHLHIIGELTHPIEHELLVHESVEEPDIKIIHAHPQVFAQCSHFLADFGNVEIKTCSSTSEAMMKVNELHSPTAAVIGSAQSGKFYSLKSIKSSLANQKENHSRFIVVSKNAKRVPMQVPAKTTIVLSTVQSAGALCDALLVLKENNINLSKLESRPITGNPWEEMFYIDMHGNVDDGPMLNALEKLKATTRYLKVLGCYPTEEVSPSRIAAADALK